MNQKTKEKTFWAFYHAEKLIKEFKEPYILASGITPSGTVHIGNFREYITINAIYTVLKDNYKTEHIHIWDDYDRLRKIPQNIENKKLLEEELYKPLSEVIDPWGCHNSYAEHFITS